MHTRHSTNWAKFPALPGELVTKPAWRKALEDMVTANPLYPCCTDAPPPAFLGMVKNVARSLLSLMDEMHVSKEVKSRTDLDG